MAALHADHAPPRSQLPMCGRATTAPPGHEPPSGERGQLIDPDDLVDEFGVSLPLAASRSDCVPMSGSPPWSWPHSDAGPWPSRRSAATAASGGSMPAIGHATVSTSGVQKPAGTRSALRNAKPGGVRSGMFDATCHPNSVHARAHRAAGLSVHLQHRCATVSARQAKQHKAAEAASGDQTGEEGGREQHYEPISRAARPPFTVIPSASPRPSRSSSPGRRRGRPARSRPQHE